MRFTSVSVLLSTIGVLQRELAGTVQWGHLTQIQAGLQIVEWNRQIQQTQVNTDMLGEAKIISMRTCH